METYDTLSMATDGLRKRGYTTDFNLAFDKLICSKTETCLNPGEFEITEVYRFEGETNPSDESIVFAVESKDGQMKGVFVNGYGIYADPMSNEMIDKLSMRRS